MGVRAAARAANISPSHLSRLEGGGSCPSRTVAEQLVAVFGVEGEERAAILAAAVDDAGRDHPARR
ncbi:helix-turn-helix domain-containing protein [Streptomyces lydicus]|uniref:helix-turn-helix domain-containing protein n=1 Tax=Streptomyces lydicus TaxID=47763 RepID=UPI00379E78AC